MESNRKSPFIPLVIVILILSISATIIGYLYKDKNVINIDSNDSNIEENVTYEEKTTTIYIEENDTEEDIDEDEDFIDTKLIINDIRACLNTDNDCYKKVKEKYNNGNLELNEVEAKGINEKSNGFLYITNGEVYSEPNYIYGELSLDNGIPSITFDGNKKNTKYNNVKNIYIIDGDEYNTYYAFLTNDNELYIGSNITELYDEEIESDIYFKIINVDKFNQAKKVKSDKKFVDIRLLYLGWVSDDTRAVDIIGITENGTKELF